MDNSNNINTIPLSNLFNKLTYFDSYGSSVIFLIIITLILVIFYFYCSNMTNSQKIKNDWINQRCNLNVIPFAGYINKPDNMSAGDFTKQNFDYCVQNNMKGMTGYFLEPLSFITNTISLTANMVINSVSLCRDMMNKMRNMMAEITKQIMKLLINILLPIQKILISFKDTFGKISGVLITLVYSFIGTYYSIKSLLTVVAKALVSTLIILAAIIVLMWLTPFTWAPAAAGTAIFLAVSIPLAIMLDFFVKVFHIDLGLKIPKVPNVKKMKCFDENTILTMNDGSKQIIKNINPGDILANNNKITSIIKVSTKGSDLYDLNGVIVSDTHMVKHLDGWLRVSEHPFSRKLAFNENKPYLYCFNTESKIIVINNIIFSDWDEVYGKNLVLLKNKIQNYCLTNDIYKNSTENKDIHNYLASGFISETPIILKNGNIKTISEIKVGDILEEGEKVYGIVKINGSNINQYIYKIGNIIFEGGPNLIMCYDKYLTSTIDLDKNIKNKRPLKDNYLFHLLTDNKTFKVNNIGFCDYNSSIDFFLNNN